MGKYYIYIVLTRTNTVLSRLIQLFKRDEYTHASISLDKKLNSMYSFGRKTTYNPFIGVFKQEDINQGAYRFCKTLPGIIMELEVSKAQYEKVKELLDEFIYNSHMYKYNYMGLFYSLFNMTVYYNDRFLCSEFVYYVLKESGIIDLNISRNLVRPQNLLKLESNIIYKGNIKEIKVCHNSMDTNELNIKTFSVVNK
ncbi:hypothetical protein GOQ29_00860 [Clostridium sp. D2Q-14]|uniref:hypothetical protein n=1 Tax=Anaeromonas gelatinilytica TaxID=2683194 RepID=UPI00193C367B|nr:hypothetical protein [Anaeromonas gelatinilytica]MBS4534162.1 hypothetical protein [Anaeromonas gelatinilytica]